MISVPTSLRYFLLSIEEQWMYLDGWMDPSAMDVSAVQKILKYNLNLVFREVFWRAC